MYCSCALGHYQDLLQYLLEMKVKRTTASNISNTRHSVSSHIKHRRYDAWQSIFDELRGF